MFEFVFRDPNSLKKDWLGQGDVIVRTPEVTDVLMQAHQNYAEAPLYSHFVVMTQSCDLVRRRDDFNASYITIAAAKPFKETMEEFFKMRTRKLNGADFSFYSKSEVPKGQQLLERFLNNTESEYFFLPSAGHPRIPSDLLVYLRLSIALRKEHYDVLASSKVAELDDIFQAKLGWMKGNIYSRIATPDFWEWEANPKKIRDDFFEKYIPTRDTVWLSVIQAEKLRRSVTQQKNCLGRDLSSEEVLALIEREVPTDIEILTENIVEKLIKNNIVDASDEKQVKLAKTSILKDSTLKSLLSRAG